MLKVSKTCWRLIQKMRDGRLRLSCCIMNMSFLGNQLYDRMARTGMLVRSLWF